LRAQRLARGWSQEDVVQGLLRVGIEIGEKQLGVTRNLISRWEREGNTPRAPYPKLLCLLFEASAEELGWVASSSSPIHVRVTGEDDAEQRNLLRLAGTTVVGVVPPWKASPSLPDASLEDLIPITARYRSLSSTVPSVTLLDATLAHLRILIALAGSARSQTTRTRIANAVNEAAAFAGRLSLDLGDYAAFHRYYRLAAAYATQASDDTLTAYTLGSMSYWAGVSGDGEQALSMMERAQSFLPKHVPTRIASWFAIFEGSVYSKAGDTPKTLAALGRAEESITQDQEPWSWPAPLDPRRLTKHRGFCATKLSLPAISIPALDQDLRALGQLPSRWRALSLSHLAESYVLINEIETACCLTGEAFTIGTQLQSDRVLTSIFAPRIVMRSWAAG
jgi:transcriptional regulator with XRE-family HTH domain